MLLSKFGIKYKDPAIAQKIAQELANAFMKQSQEIYEQKKVLIEQLIGSLEKEREKVIESIDRNKKALTAIETNANLTNEEKDITRARLLDYIQQDRNQLNYLETKIKEVQMQLTDIQKGQIIENANMPIEPTSPKILLNTVIGFVVGGMFAVFLVFLLEYFSKNPLRLEEESANLSAQ